MSNDALTWAWSQKVGCAAAKTVLVAMADRASEDHTCWPSIRRLVQDTELSARTIYRHINDLVAKGFLERTPVLGKGVIYRLVGVKGREDSKSRPDPCHHDTPVRMTPLSPCHPCQDDTPVTVSPDPCHCDSATRASSYEPKEEPKEKKERARARAKPIPKRAFGEFGNVRLTDEEHTRLVEQFGEDKTRMAVECLDIHIGARKGGDPYRSHYLAMRKWVFDAVDERSAKNPRASPRAVTQAQKGRQDMENIARFAIEARRSIGNDHGEIHSLEHRGAGDYLPAPVER